MRNLSKKDNLETAAGDTLNKRLFIRELDVTKKETITSVVDEIMRENGRIDVVCKYEIMIQLPYGLSRVSVKLLGGNINQLA